MLIYLEGFVENREYDLRIQKIGMKGREQGGRRESGGRGCGGKKGGRGSITSSFSFLSTHLMIGNHYRAYKRIASNWKGNVGSSVIEEVSLLSIPLLMIIILFYCYFLFQLKLQCRFQ